MALKNSFVALGQAYFYWPETKELALGADMTPKAEMSQAERIARIRSTREYPFSEGEKVLLTICGEEKDISEMSDLDLFKWVESFGNQILY